MSHKYLVTLKKDVDNITFHNQMTGSFGNAFIPKRNVAVSLDLPSSKRVYEYHLEDNEIESLKKDDRIQAIELSPEDPDSDIIIRPIAIQEGNFDKTAGNTGNFKNYALVRCNNTTNIYGTVASAGGQNYNYTLDGTGVDVVIQDSGIQADHPEWEDSNGVSRLQQIDWPTEAGLSGTYTQPAAAYQDSNGHGTHVAGIVAGKTFGWAKGANIYAMHINLGFDSTGYSIAASFDLIKSWHENKPLTATGYKRPTIVNMSWGSGRLVPYPDSITYRGVTYNPPVAPIDENYGFELVPTFTLFGTRYFIPARVDAYDVLLEELTDAGIHVCVAGGNTNHKIDIEGGADYDNTSTHSTNTYFYNRGSSPQSRTAMIVGSTDSTAYSGTEERIASYSARGPGVDIWAPGTYIISAYRTSDTTAGEYPEDNDFKQKNLRGTSMASPQVCGIGALNLQINPHMTPEQLKSKLINDSQPTLGGDVGLDNDYSNNNSLLSGGNNFAYNPYNTATNGSLTGAFTLQGTMINLNK